MMDSQLRDLLHTTVGDPPRRVTVDAVRRGVARRRRAEWATGTAAVILLAGLGIVLPARLSGPPAPAGAGSAAAGAPRYYVQTATEQPPFRQVTVVRARTTGAVMATVRCPWPKSQVAEAGTASADGRTFFLACQRSRDRPYVVTGTRIYRFRLTGSGRIHGYSPVPGGELGSGAAATRMAATPDGAWLAVSVNAGTPPGSILVLNTRTGARAVWRNGSGAPGDPVLGVGDLSWARAGHELVFQSSRCTHTRIIRCDTDQQWRVLTGPSTGGRLSGSTLLIRKTALTGRAQGYITDSVISPDGTKLTVVALHSPLGRHKPDTIDVVQVSAGTGHQLRVLFQENTGNGVFYHLFGSDPSGRFLILDAGPPQGATPNGWIDHGRLVLLKPADGSGVSQESW
jgi:hypothetical protein